MDREFALVDKNRIMSVQAKNPPPSVQPHRSTETPNEDIIENGDAYSEQSLVMASRYDSLFNFLNRTTSVSANYQGNPYSLANQSANIPDDLNTSIWITNLPPSLTHAMLLKSVRDCGKVYATVINAPGNDHVTSASKIVFFDAVGAKNLMRQAHDGKFVVGGYMPKVRHNRIKSEPKAPSPCSRVLHIEGPSSIVNQPFLQAVFKSRGITWQDEEVLVLYINEIVTRLEWRFGSYRCQAEFARNAIEKAKKGWDLTNEVEYEQSQLWKNVTVHFGIDPCAPKEGTRFCVISYLTFLLLLKSHN